MTKLDQISAYVETAKAAQSELDAQAITFAEMPKLLRALEMALPYVPAAELQKIETMLNQEAPSDANNKTSTNVQKG